MAVKHAIFPEVQGDTVPATIVNEWADGVKKSFEAGGKFNTRIFLTLGTKTDWDQKVGITSADNFDGGEVLQAGVLPNGLTGAVAEMKQRSNLLTRGFRKWVRAIEEFLANPEAIDRSIAKGRDNLVELLPTLGAVGVKSLGIPGIVASAAMFLANDNKWKTRTSMNRRVLEDDEDSCFDLSLRRNAVAALTSLGTQSIVVVKNAMRAGIDQAVLAAAIAEFNTRLLTTATGFARAGVTIDTYRVVTDPQLGLEVQCSPSATT